jgi:hypothetical protein
MYKLERQITTSGVWQEVLLSPFKTRVEAIDNYKKYSIYYPLSDRKYRITNLETGGKKIN